MLCLQKNIILIEAIAVTQIVDTVHTKKNNYEKSRVF